MTRLVALLKIPPKDLAESQKKQIIFWLKVELAKNFFGVPLSRLKAKIWNARVLLWWYQLWIRRNEFDRSLNNDQSARNAMSDAQRDEYDRDLARRRRTAHLRDLRGEEYSWRSIVGDMISLVSRKR